MSVYDKRYNVSANMVSHYTDDPREALRLFDRGMEAYEAGRTRYPPWCAEGYGSYRDFPCGDGYRSEVTRRTLGPLTRQNLVARIARLEYAEQRALVQCMIEAGRAAA